MNTLGYVNYLKVTGMYRRFELGSTYQLSKVVIFNSYTNDVRVYCLVNGIRSKLANFRWNTLLGNGAFMSCGSVESQYLKNFILNSNIKDY